MDTLVLIASLNSRFQALEMEINFLVFRVGAMFNSTPVTTELTFNGFCRFTDDYYYFFFVYCINLLNMASTSEVLGMLFLP